MWRGGGVPVNTLLLGVRSLVRGVVTLALLPLLISRIGAAPTGLFVFATTLIGYFAAVEYGLGVSVTKYVAEHRATGDSQQLNSVLRASLLAFLGVGVAIAAVLALLAVLGGEALFGEASVAGQALPTLLVAALSALLYWPSRIGPAALRGLERYDVSAVIEMACGVLTFVLIDLVSHRTHSVAALAAVFAGVLVLEGVASGLVALPHLGLRRGGGNWRGGHLRPVLGFSAGLFLIGIADTLIYETDRLVLAAFVGAAAIVVYEVALRPHTAVRLISGLIGSALISTTSRLVAQRRGARLRELVLVGTLYAIVLTVPFVVLIVVLAHPLVEAWVGHGYGAHAVYVQIFVSYWFVGASTGVLASAIVGIGRMRVFVWLTVGGALVTLALSIGLTAAWGTVGVILGTVIPSWIGVPLWLYFALAQIGIAKTLFLRDVLLPAYLPILAWSAPVLVLARALDPRSLLELAAFCAVALAALWLPLAPFLQARWRRAVSVLTRDLPAAVAVSGPAGPAPAPGR
jgi:O-antigen/teichoic acid export membrane protein